jgi:hypothetical protein
MWLMTWRHRSLRGSVAVLLAIALPAATARAQQTTPAPAPPYDAPDPWVAPAPPGAPKPSYGYGVAAPGAPTPMQLVAFESQKKSPPLALVLELFVFPGIGSIYGDHVEGAFITWGGTAAGLVLVLVGVSKREETVYTPGGPRTTGDAATANGLIAAGCVALIASKVYGLVDSWRSTKAYNAALARRLGLPPLAATVAPVRTDRGLAWGPALQLRF